MCRFAALHLLLLLRVCRGFLQNQPQLQPQQLSCARPSASLPPSKYKYKSFLLRANNAIGKAEEEEWLAMKQKREAQQKEWDRKISAKNERKASEKRVSASDEMRSNPNAPRFVKPPPELVAEVQAKTEAAKEKERETMNTEKQKQKDETNAEKVDDDDASTCTHYVSQDAITFAQAHAAELIALAGPKFDGNLLGVGGLNEVIDELKRRVWTPLAAPPSVMTELGITPIQGVLLWGSSGCGKTLLARTIGKLLSPARPLTVVSGPQLMDKFVGSSEKNLRELFDNPSPVFDPYRISGGKGMDDAALHVIVLDEFDAMARTRGGGDGSNNGSGSSNGNSNGEAGVARDSVVNQILAKMDGVDPLAVPTLVIALTNRPSLIDPALLRPGRFEVQIEVPPPRTSEQRTAVLEVHMGKMMESGRLLVRDAPPHKCVAPADAARAPFAYLELLRHLADLCEGFSGASLAAIPRAAAARALERAVSKYSIEVTERVNNSNAQSGTGTTQSPPPPPLPPNKVINQGKQDAIAMLDCIVTVDDLESAVQDVWRSAETTLRQQSQSQSQSSSSSSSQAPNRNPNQPPQTPTPTPTGTAGSMEVETFFPMPEQ